ncbi:MAG: AlpA family phage regulatory protein [Rhodospirillaceae bacterium]|nr:AlpA family phage regulatory protein [Rhodospirillaceae bacterium]MDE0363403.1 AlpA family phage regulatory protein [Rhodospirillaceae bacterium]
MDIEDVGLRLLPIAAVVEKAGISRPYIWKLIGQGAFPRPLHLGKRARAWRSDEIDAWIEARTAARDGRTSRKASVSVEA